MSPYDIDLATIRTWPATITEQRNGWYHLASGGVTGRVNAVWPLEWSGASLDAAIDEAEAWYAARALPPRFKLTDGAVAPENLAEALTRRGYQPVYPVRIMTAPIAAHAPAPGVSVSAEISPLFDAALRDTAKDAAEYEERRNIAARAPQPSAYAVIEQDGRAAAIGLAAASEGLAGVFLMRTVPEARRRGLAARVLETLLARCADWGVRTVFLQVEADNAPAIALYERAGFSTLTTYRFWRR